MPLRYRLTEHRLRAVFYLFVVPILILLVLVGGVKNWRDENHHALNQAKINQVHITELRAADRKIRHALAEVCHSQTLTYGILNAVVAYFDAQYPHPNLNQRTIKDTLAGYARGFNQQTACDTIAKP